ncbi:hypothetical protein [Bradyrhizobium prioriisuperbiae]|uniref:hypothetical protein n=1 Tax=Bradyrhizobium prioriisuperbiae TaxID=2854389 RepID=UPI0028EE3EEC|nr:hypothetical protein [Bradyrhizobium prioritasuperba]
MRIFSCVFLLMIGSLLVACSTVPPLSEATGAIPIRDIVERVKCELADSFSEKIQEPQFRWLQQWTAKVDMTLIANNLGSVTPVGAYVEPLGTVSGVAQQFSFGAGASVSGQAIRTEAISFSLSLLELRRWRRGLLVRSAKYRLPDPCDPGLRSNLAGDLGLREWVDSALSPVATRDLQAGDHPAPGTAKAAAIAPAVPKSANVAATKQPKEIADEAAKLSKDAYAAAKKSADEAERAATSAELSLKESPFRDVEDAEFLRQSRAIAVMARQQALKARDDATRAKTKNDLVVDIATNMKEGDTSPEAYTKANQAKTNADDVVDLAADAAEQSKAAGENAGNVTKRIPDPPIDSVSHSVQFVVTAGASIAPTWTLVRFRGPIGNLAGVTATQTHTLNIALGPRGDNGARYSQEAVRALNNLTLQQIRLAS